VVRGTSLSFVITAYKYDNMDELKGDNMAGLLDDLFKKMMELGITKPPKLEQSDLVIEITEEEFKNATTKMLSPQQRDSITVKFVNGKMIIRVKLFGGR